MSSPWRAAGWRLAVILLIAKGLRAFNLAHESYWLDELSAIHHASQGWAHLFEHLSREDVHPPLYFALLRGWGGLFGFGEVATRSLSVLFGVLAVAFAYLVGARLAPREAERARSGSVAAALVACSPFCVYYAREARAYSLLLCLSLAATWLYLRAAPDFRPRRALPYAVTAALLLYTHVFGAFTVAAHGVAALVAGRRVALRFALTAAVVAALYLPWLPVTLAQMNRVNDGFWIGPPSPLAWTLAWLAEGPFAIAWVVATVALGLLALRRLPRERRALVGAGLVLPTVVPLLLSWVSQPIFVAKYAIAAAGLLLVVAALALLGRDRRARWGLALLLAVGVAETLRDVHLRRQKEQWRELAAFASRQSVDHGIPLVLTAHFAGYLGHYLDPRATLWPMKVELEMDGPRVLVERLAAAGRDRFWLLNIHPPRTDPEVLAALRTHWVPTERRAFHLAEAILWVDARHVPGHKEGEGEAP